MRQMLTLNREDHMVSESTTADVMSEMKKIGEIEGGHAQPCRVLVVEDDLDDQILAKKRLSISPLVESIVFFSDGTELFNYLYDQGFQDASAAATRIDAQYPTVNHWQGTLNASAEDRQVALDVVMAKGAIGFDSYENVMNVVDSNRPSDHNMVISDLVL